MESAVAWEEAQVRSRHVAPSTHHRFANLITRDGGVDPTIRFVLACFHDVVHHHILRIIGCADDESRRSRYVKTAASAAPMYRRIHVALYWSNGPSVAPDIVGYQSTCVGREVSSSSFTFWEQELFVFAWLRRCVTR